MAGLAGGNLVLQNNGGDDLTVTGNGPFTFPTKLASGSAYAITVKPGGLPVGMGQSCAVSSGSGMVGSADVTSVRVRCSFTLSGPGGSIPDGPGACGTPGAPFVSTVFVDGGFFNVGSLLLSVSFVTHSWSGDLRMVLAHMPTGTQVTVFDKMRMGSCNANDRLTGTFQFSEAFSPTFCAVASTSGRTLDGGSYAPCDVMSRATSFSAAPPAGFGGESVQGTWQLTITDNDDSDVGSVSGWSLTFSPP